ncbi:MAG: protein kinase [Gemmatimonadaceae bacterium]|nr:protein kinase [Gemmatimonadaceae bacterium]
MESSTLPQTCSKCGAPTAPDAIFCSRCGLNFTLEHSAFRTTQSAAGDDAIQRLNSALAGHYAVSRELGRGGMATVYLANDLKHDREVAIKVLLPELAASIGADRFEREIRLAAKLQHPHILGLYDSGIGEGLMYYVMPFVKGESLRDRLDREGQLPVEDAIRITLEVADALGFAHEQGIVHRDIKPENILLSGEHALVADFGIARAVSEAGTQKLTQTGMAVGTPVYMSPEQSLGEVVGPTADLYSLGCVLYEMLAGEPPFTGKNAMAIMARHSMEQVPSIRIVRSAVPEEVEEAIFQALGKSPADRPQNAAAFSALMGMPLGATATMRARATGPGRRMTATYQAVEVAEPTPWWKRPLTVGVATLALAAAAFGAYTKFGRGPAADAGPESRRLAVLYLQDLSRDSSLGPIADGLTEELIRTLSNSASLSVISRSGVERFRGSDAMPDSISRALRAGYLVRGDVELDGSAVRVNIRLEDGSGATLRRATFSGSNENQLALRDTVAVVAADIIRQELGHDLQLKEQRFRTKSRDAWLLAQRAEQAWKNAEAALGRGEAEAGASGFGSADSLFALASLADRSWPEPQTRRGALAYRRARLAGGDAAKIREWVTLGMAHTDSALAIDADDPDALEWRGSLRYFGYLSGIEADKAKKAADFAAARTDLERSTALNRSQAGAYATLSHLYNNAVDATPSDVLIAAQRAYEADEFLANANVILGRMFTANYDLGQFERAAQRCTEARRRFPKDLRAMRCRLYLLTAPDAPTDVTAAWAIADSAVALVAPGAQARERMTEDMLVAAVLARASKTTPALADSARRVVKRSLGDAKSDPLRELAYFGSFVHALLGDSADAVRLLKEFLAANPDRIETMRADPGWWFKSLQNDAKFKQLLGAQ